MAKHKKKGKDKANVKKACQNLNKKNEDKKMPDLILDGKKISNINEYVNPEDFLISDEGKYDMLEPDDFI